MQIKVLGSSSAGNGYIVEDGDRTVLLEAGMPINKALEAADNIPDLLFVSHEHQDHAKYVSEYVDAGIGVVTSDDCANSIGLSFVDRVKSSDVYTERVMHDPSITTECCVYTGETGKAALLTDAREFEQFKGLTHLLIEANWSHETVDTDLYHTERAMKVHQSLENAIKYINAMDISKLEEVWLIHLSKDNANADLFRSRVEKILPERINIKIGGHDA